MGYISDSGVVVTQNPYTHVSAHQDQIPGFEQFVAGKKIKLTEGLPAMRDGVDYDQQYTYIVPIMINNGHPSGGVYSDLIGDARYDAYKIFSRDRGAQVRWEKENGWVMYDFKKETYVHGYILTMPLYGDTNSFPRSWKVYGSNDNRNWVELDSRYYEAPEVAQQYYYECIAPHSFRYIKFIFSETRGYVGYSVLCNIDYLGVSKLAFGQEFDATMPVFMYHTEYQQTVENFPNVVKIKDYYKDPDPFNDGSCVCYLPMEYNLDDLTGNFVFTANNFTPNYIDLGYQGRPALNFSSYVTNQNIKSDKKIEIENLDAITICAWIRQDWYNYSEWQSVWHLTATDSNLEDGARVSALWFHDDASTRLHYSLWSDGTQMSVSTPNYTVTRHKWQFYTVIQRKNGYELYLDGKFVHGQNTYKTAKMLKDSWIYIGDPWHYKAYQIQDFRIFNRELSHDEMWELQASGRTSALLKDNRKPMAFSIVDSSHKFNNKEMPLTITDVEFLRTRKKFRYIDYRLTAGNSVNAANHIVEVQALDDDWNPLSIGAPVKVYEGNYPERITDGDIDSQNYFYVDSNRPAYVRIDLGEPKDIRYVQFWNYYADYRYYKNIEVRLTNEPSNWVYRLDEEGYIFKTKYRGYYTETVNGKITSNLNYDYEFKVTYELDYFKYPPEFFFDLEFSYWRPYSKFYYLFMENQRNLWMLKPRLNKILNERVQITDSGHVAFYRPHSIKEFVESQDVTANYMPQFAYVNENIEVMEQPIEIITTGAADGALEDISTFEYINPTRTFGDYRVDPFNDGSEMIYIPLQGDLTTFGGDGVSFSATPTFIESERGGKMLRFNRSQVLRVYGNYLRERAATIVMRVRIMDGHYNYNTIWDDGASNDTEVWVPSNGILHFRPKDGGAYSTGYYMNVDETYDMAIVYGETKTKAYINGVKVYEHNNEGPLRTRDIFFGGQANYRFGGGMSNIRIFNRELSDIEIRRLTHFGNNTGTALAKSPEEVVNITETAQVYINRYDCTNDCGCKRNLEFGKTYETVVAQLIFIPVHAVEDSEIEETVDVISVVGQAESSPIEESQGSEIVDMITVVGSVEESIDQENINEQIAYVSVVGTPQETTENSEVSESVYYKIKVIKQAPLDTSDIEEATNEVVS